MMVALRRTAALFAIAGCLAACATALLTGASIASRSVGSRAISGDVELTQFGIALCISLCLPWAQLRSANIIVDFFTQKAGPATLQGLDTAGSLLLALMTAVLAWRTAAGALMVHEAGETSMILGLPMWWCYAALAPGLALTAVIALVQAARRWRGLEAAL